MKLRCVVIGEADTRDLAFHERPVKLSCQIILSFVTFEIEVTSDAVIKANRNG